MKKSNLLRRLDDLYSQLNKAEFISPDPLEFLYHYDSRADREVVGVIAASLAFGKVSQILRSTQRVLEPMHPSPAAFIRTKDYDELCTVFQGFRHRWTTHEDLCAMLCNIKTTLQDFESLEDCLLSGLDTNEPTLLTGLTTLGNHLKAHSHPCKIIASPTKGSACKRLNLFLRWMVRNDEVDPGCWRRVPASKLIVPLDTHMHRLAQRLGLTERRDGTMRTALHITEGFRSLRPDDPVRYDFSLTRLGIRDDMDEDHFFKSEGG